MYILTTLTNPLKKYVIRLHNLISMNIFEFAKSRAMRACVPTCLPASVVYVPTCLRANVPKACQVLIFTCKRAKNVSTCHKACQCFNLACQHDKRRANFSTWHANVPKSVPIFQTFLSRNAKGNFYTLLLYKNFYNILDIISCVYVSYI